MFTPVVTEFVQFPLCARQCVVCCSVLQPRGCLSDPFQQLQHIKQMQSKVKLVKQSPATVISDYINSLHKQPNKIKKEHINAAFFNGKLLIFCMSLDIASTWMHVCMCICQKKKMFYKSSAWNGILWYPKMINIFGLYKQQHL